MTPLRLALVLVFIVSAAVPVGVDALTRSEQREQVAHEVEARRVVAQFFRTLNERRYQETCDLLADGYFRRRDGSTRRLCAIGLQAGFLWSQEIRWRITDVWWQGNLIVVSTIADGAPGFLLLVRAKAGLRVLDVVELGNRRVRL